MRPGTREHKELFCSTFIATHPRYEPSELNWPELEPLYLERVRSIPFWGTARATETRAGVMVAEFARSISDPLIRQAIEVQGIEEARHARMMEHLIERYDLPAKDVSLPHRGASRDEFMGFGYEECLDAFLGFALFGLARKVEYFPAAFLSIFENILMEEARHVTFFVNWVRYEEARAGRDDYFLRTATTVRNYARSLNRLIDSFSGDVNATGFAASGAGAIFADVTPRSFLESALAENERYMSRLDPRLIKPNLLPTLATIILMALRALPPAKKSGAVLPSQNGTLAHTAGAETISRP
ncbi:MAG TPA: ferritin-like domain-containing protein [Candidatus Baltobacteraceae bacterium]|nr:ferritin-like domain-containing protein [Candidatus Baltobacteraceae bacterium]